MIDVLQSISLLLGWLYFVAWSISFYPQVLLNYRRKSISGLSLDFQAYNLTGFTFYSIYTYTLYILQSNHSYDCCIQHNAVQFNDLVFALHALLLTLITVYQCILYKTNKQSISHTHLYIVLLLWCVAIYNCILSMFDQLEWVTGQYNTIQYFGYSKAFISLIKYTPQAYLNYTRQSTIGFSIYNILLDFTGGTLSFAQQALDSYRFDDMTIITGNIPKLLLACISIVFDVLFIIQHYVLYIHNNIHKHEILINHEQSSDDGMYNDLIHNNLSDAVPLKVTDTTRLSQ